MTDRNPVIQVRSVAKAFELYKRPQDMFLEALFGGVRHDLFWALRNVDLTVYEHQRLGIIGPNGAGKSTLLKLITGNLQPSSGSVEVHGRISALLSVAPAWHLEESGLDNIRFNLTLLGVPEERIGEMAEEIIDFTELGAFIYQPVKTYSTGMGARLSFAIATAIVPDILIIDEVLGTGDAYFAAKARERMERMCASGRALLLVSHAISAIQQLCDTVLWLQDGVVRMLGPAEYVLQSYEEDSRRSEDELTRSDNVAARARMAGFMGTGDLDDPQALRIRLVGSDGNLHDTHYVRNVVVEVGEERRPVDLGLKIEDGDAAPHLDVVNSEWGRAYSREGSECRTLTACSGRRPGGHVVVPAVWSGDERRATVRLSFDESSLGNSSLSAQFGDARTGQWVDMERVERSNADGDWHRSTFSSEVVRPTEAEASSALEALAERSRQDVEITDAYIETGRGRTSVVTEREGFRVCLEVRAHRRVESADVGIQIMRSDGVYVFWQSAGVVGTKLADLDGDYAVYFDFDMNCLGSGEYSVTVYATNAWDLETNYPYSQVHDRKVGFLSFKVLRRVDVLDYGQIDLEVPVRVERRPGDRTPEDGRVGAEPESGAG